MFYTVYPSFLLSSWHLAEPHIVSVALPRHNHLFDTEWSVKTKHRLNPLTGIKTAEQRAII